MASLEQGIQRRPRAVAGTLGRLVRRPHLHLFSWAGENYFGSLYACRCGEIRPGL